MEDSINVRSSRLALPACILIGAPTGLRHGAIAAHHRPCRSFLIVTWSHRVPQPTVKNVITKVDYFDYKTPCSSWSPNFQGPFADIDSYPSTGKFTMDGLVSSGYHDPTRSDYFSYGTAQSYINPDGSIICPSQQISWRESLVRPVQERIDM
jgi:hypothetical protein